MREDWGGLEGSRAVTGRRQRRISTLAALTVAWALLASTAVALTLTGEEPQRSPALCAEGDPNPEPGIQGEVPSGTTPDWDCGVRPVGFLEGADGAMAVAGTCAYTGGGGGADGGVRVIDVADPTAPKLVTVLDTGSRELLAAEVAGDRALLATRHREAEARDGQVLGRDMLVDVWDIRTCTDPQLLGTVRLPTQSDVFGDGPGPLDRVGGPAHNLKFNPSATRLYGSIPLQEIDLTNLDDPATWTVRTLKCTITEQHHLPHQAVPGLCDFVREDVNPFGTAEATPQIDHEPTFNLDGSRLYIGGQTHYPDGTAMWVLDMTGPDPVVLSVTDQAPGHSIDFMTIDGREYLLHSNEISVSPSCIPGSIRPTWLGWADRAFILDVTDPAAPQKLSQVRLAAAGDDRCVPAPDGPSVAYHEVDDPTDSTYAIIGFGSSGHRIFDVRDPANPVEVAYFNRGVSSHTKSYVIPETGHIWAVNDRGFWVVELEPQVRAHLGLGDGGAPCERPGNAPPERKPGTPCPPGNGKPDAG